MKEYNVKKYFYVVIICIKYINKNVYDGIFLNEFVNYLEIMFIYLFKLFKKEMGIILSEYI